MADAEEAAPRRRRVHALPERAGEPLLKRLIITGDDFGAAIPVNEAIEKAHRDGILTTASLMVGGDAAEDAVARARRMPTLGVGLHVVLVCGRPVLPESAIPDLVDGRGRFSSRLVAAGFAFFFKRRVRDQLRAEIEAQFERFRDTGLELDHVNAHNHMHFHPTVLGLILEVGRKFGVRAVRVPYEPFLASWRATGDGALGRLVSAILYWPLSAVMRRRLRRAGVVGNDFVFGLNDSGRMDRARLLGYLAHLPDGVSEIYCHPATRRWPDMDPAMAGYAVEDELAALTDPAVRARLQQGDIAPVAFRDLAAAEGTHVAGHAAL